MQSSGINVIRDNLPLLMDGLGTTVLVAAISMAVSLAGGLFFGLARVSHTPWIRAASRSLVEIIRIVPLMVLLMICYFLLPRILGTSISSELSAVLVFSFWGTVEMGELLRGALESIPVQQGEAGRSLGLSGVQVFYYILLPQTVRRIIPSGINLATRIIKTTSLIVLIGAVDVVKRGQQIIERTKESFWIYAFLFVLFFLICYPLSLASRRLERTWSVL